MKYRSCSHIVLGACAERAVSQNIASQTLNSNCPEGVTDLQLCICTDNFIAVSSRMSASVSATCGSTASDDQASASTVLSAYCNQASVVTSPTPAHLVSSYINEITAISDLAPKRVECSGSSGEVQRQSASQQCIPDRANFHEDVPQLPT